MGLFGDFFSALTGYGDSTPQGDNQGGELIQTADMRCTECRHLFRNGDGQWCCDHNTSEGVTLVDFSGRIVTDDNYSDLYRDYSCEECGRHIYNRQFDKK